MSVLLPWQAISCQEGKRSCSPARKSLEIFENLVRARPLARRDDNVDIALSAAIHGVIGDARRVYPKRSQLVAPGHGGALILERTDGLPPVKPRIANRYWRVLGGTTQEAQTTHLHEGTPAVSVFGSKCAATLMTPAALAAGHSKRDCRACNALAASCRAVRFSQ
jgi:hypothetical protein